MANRSRGRTDEVLDGLETLVRAGRTAEVEELLTTLIEGVADDAPDDERQTRAYAEGIRDGIALSRGAESGENAAESG